MDNFEFARLGDRARGPSHLSITFEVPGTGQQVTATSPEAILLLMIFNELRAQRTAKPGAES